ADLPARAGRLRGVRQYPGAARPYRLRRDRDPAPAGVLRRPRWRELYRGRTATEDSTMTHEHSASDRAGATAEDPVEVIAALFASEGLAGYLGEDVTQAVHMLQTAALAERDGAGDALIAAALLHDVGHFTGAVTGQDLMRGTDN